MIRLRLHITPSRTVSNGFSDVGHGLFAVNCDVALEPPTKGILPEASSAGRFQLSPGGRTYPKVQIFTVEDYFAGKRPDLPDTSDTLKKAKRIQKDTGQRKLEL